MLEYGLSKVAFLYATLQQIFPCPNIKLGKVVATMDGRMIHERPRVSAASDWLSSRIPRKFPYFPQIGDELVYFRQGHQQYIDHVRDTNLYELDRRVMHESPWITYPNLEPEIGVQLIDLSYQIKPRVLAVLVLKLRRKTSLMEPVDTITVAYHHIPEVPDFLICRQLYNRSIRHSWKPNERFRCLMNDSWWFGNILTVTPVSDKFPGSKFQSCKIRWDRDSKATLSPWDIDLIPDVFEIPDGSQEGVIPATEPDKRSELYAAFYDDWPPEGDQAAECERISSLLTVVMTRGFAPAFVNPVNLTSYPDYALLVPYPIDLSTIKARLDSRFYRRKKALNFDLRHIAINAEMYNLPRTDIVKQARIVRDLCLLISNDPGITDVEQEYYRILGKFKWGHEDVVMLPTVYPEVVPHKLNSNVVIDPQPSTSMAVPIVTVSQSNHKPGNSSGSNISKTVPIPDGSRSWQKRCKEVLNKLWNSSDSLPFRAPVDMLEVPNYYQVIDMPMDLQSVKEDLEGGNYKSALEFSKDIDLIISNSKKFNTDSNFEIYRMTLRLEDLFDTLIQPVLGGRRRKSQTLESRKQRLRDKYLIPASPKNISNAGSPATRNGNSARKRPRTAKRPCRDDPAPPTVPTTSTSSEPRNVEENIQVHIQGIHETLKELLRIKKLKYASLGLI